MTDGTMHGFRVANFDSDEAEDDYEYETIFDSGLIYDTYEEADEAGKDYIAAHR